VKTVEELNHFLPRVGMRCRCVLDNGEVIIYSSSYSYGPDRIEFSEIDEKKQHSTYFVLERIGGARTRLTIDYCLKKSILRQTLFALMKKKKMEETYHKSLHNLEGLLREIRLPA
jgi:hypothetical protein